MLSIVAIGDDALKRPGRFDRVVFVPPPDAPARQRILELALADRALRDARATTTDWLRAARNYVEFANHGGRYDDVLAYLDSPAGKAARNPSPARAAQPSSARSSSGSVTGR